MPLGVSRRVLNTSTAVIDDLIEEYGEKPGLINLAPGAPAVTPCAATLKAASDAAADAFVSAYGDVLGFEPLCKRWLDQIVSSWEAQALAYPQYASEFSDLSPDKVDKVELMVTAGANQVCGLHLIVTLLVFFDLCADFLVLLVASSVSSGRRRSCLLF